MNDDKTDKPGPVQTAREIFGGNMTVVWRRLVLMLFSFIMLCTGWFFHEVYAFKDTYVRASTFVKFVDKHDKDLCELNKEVKDEIRSMKLSFDGLKTFLLQDYSARALESERKRKLKSDGHDYNEGTGD